MIKKQENVLQDYALLEEEIGILEERRDALKPKILTLLEKDGTDTLREDYGTFSIVYRKKWTYSSSLAEKEKQYNAIIKADKKEEEENGEAKAEEMKGLSYRKYEPKK